MTDRPSDADTARVVAEQHGEPHPHLHYKYCNKTDTGWFFDPSSMDSGEYADPRDDPDAALELLGHLRLRKTMPVRVELDPVEGDWVVCYWPSGDRNPTVLHLPLSSEPFRYAVVALAVKVMGGGE